MVATVMSSGLLVTMEGFPCSGSIQRCPKDEVEFEEWFLAVEVVFTLQMVFGGIVEMVFGGIVFSSGVHEWHHEYPSHCFVTIEEVL